MEKFPSLERERERANLGLQGQYPAVKTPEYNHTAEVIFAFPSLQLHLKSEHLQRGHLPLASEEKPKVDCSFITDFEDHIFVTVDADAFFFLHDLISSYVREKERVVSFVLNHTLHRKSKFLFVFRYLRRLRAICEHRAQNCPKEGQTPVPCPCHRKSAPTHKTPVCQRAQASALRYHCPQAMKTRSDAYSNRSTGATLNAKPGISNRP